MSEEIKIRTVPDLTKHLISLWEEKQKEALELQAEQEQGLKEAISQEAALQDPLKKARKIVLKMQEEYRRLEIRSEEKRRSEIEKISLRKKDVLGGKITLREFQQKGISEDKITQKVIEESLAELENSLKACREKNLEILKLEKQLAQAQNRIRGILLQPAKIIHRTFKDCVEISEREIGEFSTEIISSRSVLDQVNHKLLLTQGKSLTPGYRWDGLSLKEAHQVIFDPILPTSCVQALKIELLKYQEAESVSIVFYLRSKSVDVTPRFKKLPHRERTIKLSDLREK